MSKISATRVPARYIHINEGQSGQRLDNYLHTYLKKVPKTRIYRMVRKGEVRVNKKRVLPAYRLQVGDQLRIPPLHQDLINLPPKPSLGLVKQLKARILYENKDLLIIDKPAGMPVHGGTGVSAGIVEALRQIFPEYPELELAHRLDRDTSGCLVLAKKRKALREFHQLLRQGQVCKIYWALTQGKWRQSELRVDVPLYKNRLHSGERIVKVETDGKPSLTVFKLLSTYQDASLVAARLHTGRTHQIRVHAAYQKHPIAGDSKYGDLIFNQKMQAYGLKRLFLHAYSIEFCMPTAEKRILVTAPLDPELEQCLEAL